jgi:hypothetical protein
MISPVMALRVQD